MFVKEIVDTMTLIFIVVLETTTSSSSMHCHTEIPNGNVEYLIIPMRFEEPKHVLSTPDVFNINQMKDAQPSLLQRFRNAFVNSHPKYWKNSHPYTGNKYHRYPSYPKGFSRNPKVLVRPLASRPHLWTTGYNTMESMKYPSPEPPSIVFTDYVAGIEGDFQVTKSLSSALPPEITTYHSPEMSQNYLFEEPTSQTKNLKKEPEEMLNSEQNNEDNYQYQSDKSSQFNFGDTDLENSKGGILSQSHQKESEDTESQGFKIVVPDQEYEEDVKVELTRNSTQNEDQYNLNNRKPITFDTRPVAYLQGNEDFLLEKRPLYVGKEEENSTEFEKTSKLINLPVITAEQEHEENKDFEVFQSVNQENSKGVPAENFSLSLDFNKETATVVTVTPSTTHAN